MKIIIKLLDKREIETEISEQDFEVLKKDLTEGKNKFLNVENQILRTSMIAEIKPQKEDIPEDYRLSEPEYRPESGFQKVDKPKRMENLFNLLKKKGLFKEYNSYQDWEKEKYKK